MTTMTRALPSLEEPPPGTACESCGLELRIPGFCPECFEHAMQAREQAIAAQLREARRRTRNRMAMRGARA